MSSSIMRTLQICKPVSLPVSSSSSSEERGLLRRRLSSLSRNQPSTTDAMGGNSMKEWWEWSWSLILSTKLPIFITDLEPKSSLGRTSLLTNVFFKFRSGIHRLLRPSSSDSLPLSSNHGHGHR